MKVIFCEPQLTMDHSENANLFFKSCQDILDVYVVERMYISSLFQINQLLAGDADANNIFVFFNAQNGIYKPEFLKVIEKYNIAQSRIWAIAMERNPECRMPPASISDKQSFDVFSRNENRSPMKNNMKAIAQLFARRIIAQTLSPLYRDEVFYFISHRRVDGEHITAKLADQFRLLTRERNVYRDVVNVEVGDDAQKDINKDLDKSDVLIFLQTEQAQYSEFIIKELCHALINDIPVLWIQIDHASYANMKILPGEKPLLHYASDEFDCEDRLIEIIDEIEENCFQLIMNSSNQVYSHIEYLRELDRTGKIKFKNDANSFMSYEVQYKEEIRDFYDKGIRKHYVTCFGRNPKNEDRQVFIDKAKKSGFYENSDRLFLLSNHGCREKHVDDLKVIEEKYDDYIINLENVAGKNRIIKNKRIILSGAFPDCDEIYNNSLLEAVVVYSREIIKNGYTLVFGAHPTFQKLIFDIGSRYATNIKDSIEMHMDKAYMSEYDLEELQENCTLILSDGLQEMRKRMICEKKGEMFICLGGKIKENKAEQGVDIEVDLAKSVNIPIALVGSVGGRSSEYAFEKIKLRNWSDLNAWGRELNESLFYNVTHKVMIKRLLDTIN